nr:MAG: hypothetical protein [Porcellio scaber clopovirus]
MTSQKVLHLENKVFFFSEDHTLRFIFKKDGSHFFRFVDVEERRFNLSPRSLENILTQLLMVSNLKEEIFTSYPIEEYVKKEGGELKSEYIIKQSDTTEKDGEEKNDETKGEENSTKSTDENKNDSWTNLDEQEEKAVALQKAKWEYEEENVKKKFIYLTVRKDSNMDGIDMVCLANRGYKYYFNRRSDIQKLIDTRNEINHFIEEFRKLEELLHKSEDYFVKYYIDLRTQDGKLNNEKHILKTNKESEQANLSNILNSKLTMNDFKHRLITELRKTAFTPKDHFAKDIVYIITHREHEEEKILNKILDEVAQYNEICRVTE